MHPTTPDGRYFVVKGQLWRCSNPALPVEKRQHLVHDLMEARRAVKEAKALDDEDKLHAARAAVDLAKVALGERGPVWWDDGSPDYNRQKAINTPYADWYYLIDEQQ
ncbi:hypothetical protein JET76_28725 [Pseudomonas putida]|uniref:Uncharacterized protein n=2 Tax=Pseudomonas TaxID=286 RepID=A0A7W2PSI9_9PSED|nr:MULTISPECIES: hypothetical protein [Pseudomonas]MBA1216475.1 hypothetical protein [Pseudomonas fulva]MBA1319665.1 hypothetical protein [Pseudomonas monteilii]MBA6059239.1 hypothetical protein [Pseudomonas juntendi]MBA6105088.1 hypothetical protein [Pseudomonas monteilii]MBA6126411.1 hypothetical protein [Pseudomonas juntendi]